jgi:UDP-4-amino-4,6-dideoxy-N-acetyl-beta-L-altrosamine transaminase
LIPYGRQDVTQADIDAVVAVLQSDFLTQGPAVPRFEGLVMDQVGAPYALAMSSATAALHVACAALDLGPGDIVWTVPNTFVASANCARYCGADVDFVDIDPRTWCMSVESLRLKLERAHREGRLPKAVVPVHFGGQPNEQEQVWELAQQYGFRVIEDASHSIGASRNGETVGSCRWSDITVFSFHPVKIITTCEGGMALTRDRALAERMAMLRSHGITRDAGKFVGERGGAWYYEQQLLGYNYRMTDVQAALGSSQLARLPQYVARRNALAQRYDAALKDLPLQLPTLLPGNVSAFHLYVVHLRNASRDVIFDELRKREIGVNVHYTPVHLQPYYRQLGFEPGQYPHAEAHGANSLTLPLFPGLTEQQQDRVVAAFRDLL